MTCLTHETFDNLHTCFGFLNMTNTVIQPNLANVISVASNVSFIREIALSTSKNLVWGSLEL